MSNEPRAARMVDRLDQVARILWEQDCGFVPVVDGADVLVGVLTDRDLCMASYTQGRVLSEVPVLASMSRDLQTCRPDDSIRSAMNTMQQAQVHRLPVVDARGVLVGVLAANDLVRAAEALPAAVDGSAVLTMLARIVAPRSGGRKFAVEAPATPVKKRSSRIAAAAVAEPVVKLTSKPVGKPAARSATKPVTKPAARSAGRVAAKPAGKPTRSVSKATSKKRKA